MRSPDVGVLAGRLAAVLLCAAAMAGCQSFRRDRQPALTPAAGSAFVSATPASFAAARLEAMAAADNYTTIVAQAADELRKRTKREDVADWARQQRIAT